MPTLLDATELDTLQRKTVGATRERMLREMGEALDVITAERPLLFVLEDVHWSDASTVELLSLLARRRELARFLVLATYRPVDVIMQEHPLRKIKHELQLHHLCEELSLGLLSETHVAEYLARRIETEVGRKSGRSGAAVRGSDSLSVLARLLHQRTDGNPLFMVTAVDDLVAQGALVSEDPSGPLSDDLATVTMQVPDTVQQLIEQQLERLSAEDRHLLEVASVVGMEFSAAAVAASGEIRMEDVEVRCTGLAGQARFLRTSGAAEWPDGTVAARYSFLHALYQEVLYTHIPAGRRQRWHQRIGKRQEAAYGERAREIATELAVHFEQGRDYGKAVQYLQQAGENAVYRSANVEAVRHLTTALELLKTLPDTPARARQELALRIALGVPLIATKGYAAQEVEQTYTRALELCRLIGDTMRLFSVLVGLRLFYTQAGLIDQARQTGEQLLTFAQGAQEPGLLLEAHFQHGNTLLWAGEFAAAREHFEQALALSDLLSHRKHAPFYGQDARTGSLVHLARALWLLGYPAQALLKAEQGLVHGQESAHPFNLCYAQVALTEVRMFRQEARDVQQLAEATIALAHEQGFSFWAATGTMELGWALSKQGQGAAIIEQMSETMKAWQANGTRPMFLARLAEMYGEMGQWEKGLAVLAEGLAAVEGTGGQLYEAEVWRIRGELTLQKTVDRRPSTVVEEEAEAYFLKAIDIAQKQQAKSWELRASTSLARLWQAQGKKAGAHKLLSEIYNWFTEGFETKDLQEVKALLTELSH
jgi:tetratricopeptide (TPR) repeat protein